MKKVRLLFLWLAFIPWSLSARGIDDILRALRSEPGAATADVEIAAPGQDAASYEAALMWWRGGGVAQADYLVEYRPADTDDSPTAFAALTDSALYRFDGRQFRENSNIRGGISTEMALNAPFAWLIPPMVADDIESALSADSPLRTRYDIATDGPDRLTLTLTTTTPDGTPTRSSTYRFVNPGMRLAELSTVRSPGTAAESSLHATYRAAPTLKAGADAPWQRHGDVLGLFAGANLQPASFAGFPMPRFTLPAMQGGRFTFEPRYETLIVVIDDEAVDLEEAAQQVRAGLAQCGERGAQVSIIFVTLSRWADAMRASDHPSGHETYLLDGATLLKQLGGTETPLLMLVDDYGVVESVAQGKNFKLADIVTEMIE